MTFREKNQTTMIGTVIYYGPLMSGKLTTLHYLHTYFSCLATSQLRIIPTEIDRTVAVDLIVPKSFLPSNCAFFVRLCTTTGAMLEKHSRIRHLQTADGVVFVADSQPGRMQENSTFLDELMHSLTVFHRGDIPIVLQYNKRDIPNALSRRTMDAALNRHTWPSFETVAWQYPGFEGSWKTGDGVLDAFRTMCVLLTKRHAV